MPFFERLIWNSIFECSDLHVWYQMKAYMCANMKAKHRNIQKSCFCRPDVQFQWERLFTTRKRKTLGTKVTLRLVGAFQVKFFSMFFISQWLSFLLKVFLTNNQMEFDQIYSLKKFKYWIINEMCIFKYQPLLKTSKNNYLTSIIQIYIHL